MWIFLKKKFYRQHLLGIMLIITGISLVVIAVTTKSGGSSSAETSTGEMLFGIGMICISVFIQGVQFIAEEKILGNVYVSSKRLTGWEGIWGLCFFAVFLTIAQFISCEGNLCTNGKLEDTLQAFDQVFSSLFLVISFMLI